MTPSPTPCVEAYAGNLFMVVAPSGAGKSTLVNALLARDPTIELSVSTTTRAPRPGEQDGREYHFVNVETFKALKARGDFLESAEVHGNLYGTSRQWIEARVTDGRDVLLEIDWQGARQVKSFFPYAISVFILPPSIDALEARLKNRGQDCADVIRRRLVAAGSEIAHAPEQDYIIINETFEVALEQLAAIVTAARLRCAPQTARHHDLFMQLGIP